MPNRYVRSVGGSGDGSGDSPCTGPTAFENGNGSCACANIRGMTQSGDECMCDSAWDFEWDDTTGQCGCAAGTQVKFI